MCVCKTNARVDVLNRVAYCRNESIRNFSDENLALGLPIGFHKPFLQAKLLLIKIETKLQFKYFLLVSKKTGLQNQTST